MAQPNREEPPAIGNVPAEGSAELLASLQRLTGVGTWIHEVDRSETWWSEQAKQIHGFDPDDNPTIDRVVAQYAAPDREPVKQRVERAAQEGDSFDIDVNLVGSGTTERAIRVRCEPWSNGDDIVRLHGTVQDVTETRRRKQRIEVFRQTSQRLKRAKSRQEVAEILADASKNIFGLVNTTVRLIDDEEEALRTVVATEECVERAGERPDYAIDDENPASRVYRTGEPEVYADLETSSDQYDRGELVSGIYVPIGNHGILSAGDIVVDAFNEGDLEAAALLGQVGADTLNRISWAKRSRAV